MKTLLLLLIGSWLLFAAPTLKSIAFTEPVATCYGNTPCKACSNCSKCGHCNSGGSCGICAKPKTAQTLTSSKTNTKKASNYVGQCKALTKKGARCKRSGSGSGYCWQHG